MLDKCQIREAIKILNQLVKTSPDNFAYVHDLAVALEEAGHTETSLQYFQKAVSLQPNNATQATIHWAGYIRSIIKQKKQ